MIHRTSTRRPLALAAMSVLAVSAASGVASAQDPAAPAPAPAPVEVAPPPPKIEKVEAAYAYGKMEEVKDNKAVWKASAFAGFSAATGNRTLLSFTGTGDVSRNDGKNKLAFGVKGVYGRTFDHRFVDKNGDMVLTMPTVNSPHTDEIEEFAADSANNFRFNARYDRFFTANNAGYLLFFVGLDKVANKDLYTGGQVGYSRQLVKTERHELLGELGYDFTFDRNVLTPNPSKTTQDVFLHSARVFAGYALSVNAHTGVKASIEALINLNGSLLIGDRTVGTGEATRINSKLEFTTQVWKPISFRAAMALEYNNAPSTNAPFVMTSMDHPLHYNQKVVTQTDVGLVINFL